MKYYNISYSSDEKEIGFFPQVHDGILPGHVDDPLFIDNFLYKKAPENVKVPELILDKRAIATDLLSASFMGLSLNYLVSERLKNILFSVKGFGFDSFPTKVHSRSESFNYQILHVFEICWDLIDFKASEFRRISFKTRQEDPIAFKTKEEFSAALTSQNILDGPGYYYEIKKAVFKNHSDIELFQIRSLKNSSGLFVSENLRNKIEAARCTGIVFSDFIDPLFNKS